MKSNENILKTILFMKMYTFICVFITCHRFSYVKLKETLSRTSTFAKSLVFCFCFASILCQTRSGLRQTTWRTLWEAVGRSWDTLGVWGSSGRLCPGPGQRSCGGVLGHSGCLGELWRALSGPWWSTLLGKLWKGPGTLWVSGGAL